MTLHEAIELVLRENGRPMKAKEIAFAINSGKLYFREDDAPVPTSQIHARVNKYPQLFEKNDEGEILLANGMPSSKTTERPAKVIELTGTKNNVNFNADDMKFESLQDLKNAGFEGFVKVGELKDKLSAVPQTMGVYMILRKSSHKPEFLETGSGGFFKGKNPNVSLTDLKNNWVEDTCVMYIGKAGGSASKATLRKRLSQYMNFGSGKNVGHYGGRFIWQLKDHEELIVCWKRLEGIEPEEYESFLINNFRVIYGKRPFANLTK